MQLAETHRGRAALYCVLIVGTILRLLNFPAPFNQRHSDETGYLQSSLCVLEGVPPPFKDTPAAAQIWLGWSFAGTRAAGYLIAPTAEERAASLVMRPYVAINHAVFDIYRDIGAMREFEIAIIMLVSILAIAAAFDVGKFYGGLSGAILVGGLFATLPLFVDLATQARPYSLAWSFGVFALWAATRRKSQSSRWIAAAVLLGLSIATRIELLCLLPFVLIEIDRSTPPGMRWQRIFAATVLAAIVMLAAAPWYTLGLIGNIRSIVAVRFIGMASQKPASAQTCVELFLEQGLWLAIVLLVSALFTDRAQRVPLVVAALLLLTVLRPTGYGLQHQGPAIVALVIFSAAGLARLPSRGAIALAIVGCLLPLIQTIRLIARERREYVAADPVGWLEKNIPAGTRVYWWPCMSRLPLPTRAASDAIWSELTDVDSWRKKFAWGSERVHLLASTDPPRVLADDLMAKDRGHYRCWFILGGRQNDPTPRYDIRLLGGSAMFGDHEPIENIAAREAAVFVVRDDPIPALGEPLMQISKPGASGTFIYASPKFKEMNPLINTDEHR